MSDALKRLLTDQTGQAMKDALLQIAAAINGEKGVVYGFHVDGSESNPAAMVTYLKDAVGMTPAKMNYTEDYFDYGSWKDAFFMPRPCMLKYDGTVDYYLDPDDYTKKADGTASAVADTTYGGNAMMEWGQNGKKIWIKVIPDSNPKSGTVFIADHQVDSTFHAWSFINNQGILVDHFYTPIYNGAKVDSKLRSISGLDYTYLTTAMNASAEVTAAKANNPGSEVLWNTEVYADIMLINFLLILMGKNMDTAAVFGEGRRSQASSASNILSTGTMNTKGMFWGSNTTTYGVKVFGMENWWGNQWRRYAGHINASGTEKVKLTYTTKDGSSASSYNTDGTGYLTTGVSGHTGTNGGYINEMRFSPYGMAPVAASGSSSTYFCDGLWFNDSQTDYASRGGVCDYGAHVGAFYCYLNYTASGTTWAIGAAVSCKPLAA